MGKQAFVPCVVLSSSNGELPFEMTRDQFPVAPAFAITINKMQGQTLERVDIFLPCPVVSHGQLDVAMSRTTAPDRRRIPTGGIAVYLPDRRTATCTTNVYRKMLDASGLQRHR